MARPIDLFRALDQQRLQYAPLQVLKRAEGTTVIVLAEESNLSAIRAVAQAMKIEFTAIGEDGNPDLFRGSFTFSSSKEAA